MYDQRAKVGLLQKDGPETTLPKVPSQTLKLVHGVVDALTPPPPLLTHTETTNVGAVQIPSGDAAAPDPIPSEGSSDPGAQLPPAAPGSTLGEASAPPPGPGDPPAAGGAELPAPGPQAPPEGPPQLALLPSNSGADAAAGPSTGGGAASSQGPPGGEVVEAQLDAAPPGGEVVEAQLETPSKCGIAAYVVPAWADPTLSREEREHLATAWGEAELGALPPFPQLVCRARVEIGAVKLFASSPGKLPFTHVSMDVMEQNWIEACAWQARLDLTAAYATDAGTGSQKCGGAYDVRRRWRPSVGCQPGGRAA